MIFSTHTRSGRGDAHQSLDAVLEELNADVKAWTSGQEPDSNMWRRVIRNYHKLVELRHKVNSENQHLGILLSICTCTAFHNYNVC